MAEDDEKDRMAVRAVSTVPRKNQDRNRAAELLYGVSEDTRVAWSADEVDAETSEELSHPYGPHKDANGKFKKGNTAGKALKGIPRRPVQFGVPVKLANCTDDRFRGLMINAGRYRRARSAEVSAIHGMTTAGANGMISGAADALAASKYMYLLALEAKSLKERRECLSLASKLATDARQLEIAAYDLAAKEARAVRAQDEPDTPEWMRDMVQVHESDNALERQAVNNLYKAKKK